MYAEMHSKYGDLHKKHQQKQHIILGIYIVCTTTKTTTTTRKTQRRTKEIKTKTTPK